MRHCEPNNSQIIWTGNKNRTPRDFKPGVFQKRFVHQTLLTWFMCFYHEYVGYLVKLCLFLQSELSTGLFILTIDWILWPAQSV